MKCADMTSLTSMTSHL